MKASTSNSANIAEPQATDVQLKLNASGTRQHSEIENAVEFIADSLDTSTKETTCYLSAFSYFLDDTTTEETEPTTAQAVDFKIRHFQAALAVIHKLTSELGVSTQTPIGEVQRAIDEAISNLQTQQQATPDNTFQAIKATLGGKQRQAKTSDLFGSFSSERNKLIQAGLTGKPPPLHTVHLHIRVALASFVHGFFKRSGVSMRETGINNLSKQIFEYYVNDLNSRPWAVITKKQNLYFTNSRGAVEPISFTTTMTPASKLDAALSQSYSQDKIEGVCSYTNREARHAVNMWRVQFKALDIQEAQCRFEFSGIRHGVHDAFGFTAKEERLAANDARVKEFVHACALDKLARLGMSASEFPGDVLETDIVSVNLLTAAGKEQGMVSHQQQAFERINGQVIQVPFFDTEGQFHHINVKPNLITFNTPVNKISLQPLGNLIGIWRNADAVNREGIRKLMGSEKPGKPIGGIAGEALKELHTSMALRRGMVQTVNRPDPLTEALKRKISLIKELSGQIRTIYSRKHHQLVENEPYKLPTRLLALSNEIGATPAFNCKSGKDRTGQLNVEIRDFYADLQAHNRARPVNQKREEKARTNYKTLFLDGGDREIQTLNTGVPGSKAQLPYYNKLMGVMPGTINEIRGLSGWVYT